ncbi:MAG: hypothetical protein GWP17_06270 [Aquificales bacterium]|nr:hypothetical protein [Aquificales bacterium]
MRPLTKTLFAAIFVVYVGLACNHQPTSPDKAKGWSGYTDSPYIVPDGTAIYFLHSVASTYDMLTANPNAKPVAEYFPGHQGQGGAYWWNTDIYVSFKNSDGTWGQPQNLGPSINSEHMESSPWTNAEQTELIFIRASVTDPALSGAFISRRNNTNESWGIPERLPGELGSYGTSGFTDFHMAPSGNLYFWNESNGALYWAKALANNQWAPAELLPAPFQSELEETQPWVNDSETVIYFNRRGDDGNTQLLWANRENASAEWGTPIPVHLTEFADANNNTVWGEPSFTYDEEMFFVRFDTSDPDWQADLFVAIQQSDGSFGPPQKLIFSY